MNLSLLLLKIKAVFHSVQIWARADFLELKIPHGKINHIKIYFKKDIRRALQYLGISAILKIKLEVFKSG